MLQGLEIVPVKIGPGKFACPFCSLTKPKFLEMESHIRYEHTNAKRYNRSREKKSGVWNYFESLESDPKFAMCKVCQKTLSLGSDNPRKQTLTNLKRHIESMHPDDWVKLSQLLKPTSTKRLYL